MSNKKRDTGKRLRKKEREEIVRLHASGEFTKSQLARLYDCTRQNVSQLIDRHLDKHELYKKGFKLEAEKQFGKLQSKALEQAIEKVKRLSPYQATLVASIAFDKLYPPSTNKTTINAGDNRQIVVNYPNWNKSRPPSNK